IQVPLSINPEGIRLSSAEVQTPTFKSGTVEWVDYVCKDYQEDTFYLRYTAMRQKIISNFR
ncbi:MAG: hypothetical protein KAI96_03085, partial [Thermodesulfovibrionia bacterium]|nr:hypothetical protein [Thermodesulfovibrionia bacterium]